MLREDKIGDTRDDASDITGSVTLVVFDSGITRGDGGRAPPVGFRGGLEDDDVVRTGVGLDAG